MRYIFISLLLILVLRGSSQEQRIGDTTSAGIVSYSLRSISGKGSGTRPAYFDNSGKLIAGSSTSIATWGLNGNDSVTNTHFIGTKTAQPLIFKTSNLEAFRVTPGGQVGIAGNFADSNYKLSVNGSIRTRKVRVDQDTWADYVFTTGYKPLSLQEIESFIALHGHLPEVPSAAVAKKDGIDIAVMQTLFLKKIEELTLYAIEQDKVIQKQKEVNEVQAKLIESMEKRLQTLEAIETK
ncbi:MAG TPA: hypothetical protein VM935_13460 [Chitinophagaceae bacterium]|jgi:hypothetical protein|nr:hypothetical protein [Chitinophagaceae bacterium]